MNKSKLFKILLILQIVFGVLWAVMSGFTTDNSIQNAQSTTGDHQMYRYWYLEPIMGIVVMSLIVSIIGLFWLKPVWYYVFTLSIVASVLISPFLNLIAVEGITGSIFCMTNFITGMILLLGYDLMVLSKK